MLPKTRGKIALISVHGEPTIPTIDIGKKEHMRSLVSQKIYRCQYRQYLSELTKLQQELLTPSA